MDDLKANVSYLKGLSAGIEVVQESKEGKLLAGIIGVLDNFADSMTDLASAHEKLEDYLDELDEDLYRLEDDIYSQEDDAEGDGLEIKCPRCQNLVIVGQETFEGEDTLEVTCPNCDEVIFVNDERLETADEPQDMSGLMRLEDL